MKKLDNHDCVKLKRVLKYIKGKRELKLDLSVGDMSVLKWWVGDSYLVHENCRGHTGSILSLGKVAISIFFTKQKINGNISTKDEPIGVGNDMDKMLWSR